MGQLNDIPEIITPNLKQFLTAKISNLTRSEFEEWVFQGNKVLRQFPKNHDLCEAYFQSVPELLAKQPAMSLSNWVEQGLKIAELSVKAASAYFRFIPEQPKYGRLPSVIEWSHKVLMIFRLAPSAENIALDFLHSSSQLFQFVSIRGLQRWSSIGFHILRQSPASSISYFSIIPENLASLYSLEIEKIFELTDKIAGFSSDRAIEFYQKSPELLLNLNPNIRDVVLSKVLKDAQQSEEHFDVFNEIVFALSSFSYPIQELIVSSEKPVISQSPRASRVYFRNIKRLLSEVHESFLSLWVEKGCQLLAINEQDGLDFFSFYSSQSKEVFALWKNAVFFDDSKKTLLLYGMALCGNKINLQCRETQPQEDDTNELLEYQAGPTITLPPYIAEEKTKTENFRHYKVATAHQAGYVEFNTFKPDFEAIKTQLESLPLHELALDIFFILEDGRIDFNLKQEYAGLKNDIDWVLLRSISRRTYPTHNLIKEGLEILLRYTVGLLDEQLVSPVLTEYVLSLKLILEGFFEKAESIQDCFSATQKIYFLISQLEENAKYESIDSLLFREMPDSDLFLEKGVGDEEPDLITAGEDEITEDRLLSSDDLLKDIEVEEPLKKGKAEGNFITNLDQIQAYDENKQAATDVMEEGHSSLPSLIHSAHKRGPYFYDEWDYLHQSYRRKWCCLREVDILTPQPKLFDQIHKNYSNLIRHVKAQFQRIRPEEVENIKRVDWGNEFDFNAMIESVVDRKKGDSPSDKIFTRREKKVRRIATLLLVDMSASTDRVASSLMDSSQISEENDKKIIEIEMESLVVMTEALEALNDDYAIYGFSGYGREQVDFYCIKEFEDLYSEAMKNRICGIEPQKSTRMGPAIRHATTKLRALDADHRLLIILSDGYPQDMNYGEDRTSEEYALHDTMMAMIEARRAEIKPFCITVDQCGDDYLKKMCNPKSYLTIQDIYTLPQVLPKIVESLI